MSDRIAKLIKQQRHYPRFRDKFLSFYNSLLVSHKLGWVPLPGRHRPVNIFLRGHRHPFAVRLGSTDWLVLVEILLDGEYREFSQLFAGSPPATIIDLGANVGFSIRYWLETFPGAKIIAIEPDESNCSMIKRNIALCHPAVPPTVIQACIVGLPQEQVFLETGSGREWAFAVTKNASPTARAVRGITMTSLLAECSVNGPVGLLKCDIEGAEEELFLHSDLWINRILGGVVEVHGQFTADKLVRLLGDKGMKLTHRLGSKLNVVSFKLIAPS